MRAAPDFTLPDQTGEPRSLHDYAGHWLVVYFYPKDDTPGCTTEACNFRDIYHELQQRGVQVVGISKDSVKSHAKFAAKFNLNFPLLADVDRTTIEAYGAWGRKKFMGREFDGILRQTFVIDPTGQIVKEYPEVTPKDHAAQLLQDLTELQAA
jgi:peroxiredoxin Q/BCP